MKRYFSGFVFLLLVWFVGFWNKRKAVKRVQKGVTDANKKFKKRIDSFDSASDVVSGFSDFVR